MKSVLFVACISALLVCIAAHEDFAVQPSGTNDVVEITWQEYTQDSPGDNIWNLLMSDKFVSLKDCLPGRVVRHPGYPIGVHDNHFYIDLCHQRDLPQYVSCKKFEEEESQVTIEEKTDAAWVVALKGWGEYFPAKPTNYFYHFTSLHHMISVVGFRQVSFSTKLTPENFAEILSVAPPSSWIHRALSAMNHLSQ